MTPVPFMATWVRRFGLHEPVNGKVVRASYTSTNMLANGKKTQENTANPNNTHPADTPADVHE